MAMTDLEFADTYGCHDPYGESCSGSCEECTKEFLDDLAEHDAKVRAKAVNKFVANATKEFQKFDKEHGYPTLADISVILCDVAEQLKKQNSN